MVARSCTAFQVLTHVALLKPALRAWGGGWGCRDQVLTHLALLRSALQAWCGHRGSGAGFGAWCDPEGLVLLVRLACVCDSGLKGRFPVAQGAALGDRGPKKSWFLGLKGRFQGDCGCAVMRGVPGAYARGSAETGPSGLGEIGRAHV